MLPSDHRCLSFRQKRQPLEHRGHLGKAVLDPIRWNIQNSDRQIESAKVLLVREGLVGGDKHVKLGSSLFSVE
jgi:hypothetical protein